MLTLFVAVVDLGTGVHGIKRFHCRSVIVMHSTSKPNPFKVYDVSPDNDI